MDGQCYGNCKYGNTSCPCATSCVLAQDYESDDDSDLEVDGASDLPCDDEPGANVLAEDDIPCLASFAKAFVHQRRLQTETRFDLNTTIKLGRLILTDFDETLDLFTSLKRWKRVVEAKLDRVIVDCSARTYTVQEAVYRYFLCNGRRTSLSLHQIKDLGIAAAAIMVLPLPMALRTVLTVLNDPKNRFGCTQLSRSVSAAPVMAYLLPCVLQYEMDIPWKSDFEVLRVGSEVLATRNEGELPIFSVDDDVPAFHWCNFVKACVFYTFWVMNRLPTPLCARYGSICTVGLVDLFDDGKVVPSSLHAPVRVTSLRSLLNARHLHRGPWRALCAILKHVKQVVRYNLYTFLMWRDGVLLELTVEEAVEDYLAAFLAKLTIARELDAKRAALRSCNTARPPKVLASFCAQYNAAGIRGTTTLDCIRGFARKTLAQARKDYLVECRKYVGPEVEDFVPTEVLDVIFSDSFF